MPGVLAGVKILIEHRHKNIGIISEDTFEYGQQVYEYEALRYPCKILEAFKACRISHNPRYILENCGSMEKLRTKLVELFTSHNAPTAFFCLTNTVANQTIEILNEMDIKIPNDVSIILLGDITKKIDTVSLTSICIPFYSIGNSTLDTLHDYIENGINKTKQIVLRPTFLTVRDSVGYVKK